SVASGITGVVQRTATKDVVTLTEDGGTAATPGNAQKLTNLAAGSLAADSLDAVNGSQLKSVVDQVASNSASITQLTAIVNNSIADSIVKQGDPEGPITIGALEKGDNISISGIDGDRVLSGLKDGIKASDAATVGQLQAASGNISSRDDDGFGIASATVKNSLAVGAGAKATGEESTASGLGSVASANNTTAYGYRASATAINATAIGHKSIASGSNSTALGHGSEAQGDNSLALGSNSVASGKNSVSLGHGSLASRDNTVSIGTEGRERQITNVAAGTADTDAANVGQVNQAFQSISNSVNELNSRVSDLDNKLTGGIASSMAMAGIPQAYQPDSSMLGASAASYNGKSAIAVGVSKTSENGKWILKASGSGNTENYFGASIGVGYQW
ncbi:YadA family autotransporter adhesin, partial [Serratia sp. T13T92]|uniref:YadA family autotransporter adhesin n=1 Tax=Serratia sp. T13T92 TaxID=3397496 RepID=UPI0039DFD0ED